LACRPLRPPGSSTSISRNFDVDIGLRRMTTGSALPTLPQSVPRGRSISWLHWFASATACQVARPPVRIRLERPAFGDFYFQAFNGSVLLSNSEHWPRIYRSTGLQISDEAVFALAKALLLPQRWKYSRQLFKVGNS